MSGPLLAALPLVAGAAAGAFITLKEAFKMAKEGASPKQERQQILKGEKIGAEAELVEP